MTVTTDEEDVLIEMLHLTMDTPRDRPEGFSDDDDDSEDDDDGDDDDVDDEDHHHDDDDGNDPIPGEPKTTCHEPQQGQLSEPAIKRRKIIEDVGKQRPEKNRKEEQAPSKRNHNKRCKCLFPGCKFTGFFLKRHLQTHVRDADISEWNSAKMAEVCKHGDERRTSAKTSKGKGTYK